MSFFISTYLKLFFLLTPFFVVTVFLAMTREMNDADKRLLALKVTGAIVLIGFIIYFFGKYIFQLFGITLDAFRVGAGALLFLSATALVYDGYGGKNVTGEGDDIAVVPLALPVAIGPATTGALLVMGAEMNDMGTILVAGAALICAMLSVGTLLYLAGSLERWLGQTGLVILSKLTGLILSSIAAQLIFTGARNLLR